MHRVGQFVAHVRARVEPAEEAFVARILPPGGLDLFRTMPVADRRHELDALLQRALKVADDAS